jgi:outer membrane protein assembly factor BamB
MVFATAQALLCGALGCALVAGAAAADWPQWQGPDRNGMSKETGLLQEWPKAGPPLAWKIKTLGGGDSAPAIAAGKIYGMSNRGDDEIVWALSEKDGSEVWVTPLGAALQPRMPQSKEGPSCTPTVEKDRLYVIGMGGEIACLQTADGKIVWHRSFTKDFGGRSPTWSYRESPLIDGDHLICTPGGEDALMVALDKKTGETVWKCKPASDSSSAGGGGGGGSGGGRGGRGGRGGLGAAYASAIAIDYDGVHQYVQLASKALVGVDAKDGKLLWKYAPPANGSGINISTPIFADGQIFASSAYGAGGGAIKLKKKDDGGFEPQEIYFTKRMQNHHGGMIVYEGCLYGASGGNEGGALTCLDFATGNVLWDERSERRAAKGSIAFADGRLYYRVEDGTLLLLEPNRDKYVEHGRFDQPSRTSKPAWSHPIIANGKLYIRDQETLFCYDIQKK